MGVELRAQVLSFKEDGLGFVFLKSRGRVLNFCVSGFLLRDLT